ncbi:MAG: hypothetical protein K6F95_03975 [Selenomonas sp.]|uniref:hypothetical protein n=1 Tax=Selenomonas sp. TaxID=2053611 RepID=UPI0025D73D61|nr:hypothetical protein [Selenomonas sp.]MCR5757045.1 hypothetical protein [Selenomonas sp.]
MRRKVIPSPGRPAGNADSNSPETGDDFPQLLTSLSTAEESYCQSRGDLQVALIAIAPGLVMTFRSF